MHDLPETRLIPFLFPHDNMTTHSKSSAHTPTPWHVGLSECSSVYGGEQHWAIFGAHASGGGADVEGGLGARPKANAESIVRVCNNHEQLLTACKMSLQDAKDALSGDWEPAKDGWESIIEHLTRVIGEAERNEGYCRAGSKRKTGKRGRRWSPVVSPSPVLRGVEWP